jgi:DNA-binding protein H-NS
MNNIQSTQSKNKTQIINIINKYIEKIQADNITNTELINKLDSIIAKQKEVIKNKECSEEFYILITKRKELIIKKLFYSELINGLKNRIHSLVY